MPLPDPSPTRVQAPAWAGIGLRAQIHAQWAARGDCTAQHPSWWPFVYNEPLCDGDLPPAPPYTGRMMRIPPAPPELEGLP